MVCEPSGRRWRLGTGTVGLGTSGSGDILAGVVAGLAARGADPAQATVWATHVHAEAGDRLTPRIGYLASELGEEIPRVMQELG
jgi:NAD(P)H-hydrate repair Nnr-like enzyme with NAD(P)H-hydrate dehydratase domain